MSSGLGLATSYGIVKRSGGSLWVYSEPERGTTFKIYLPRVFEAWSQVQVKAPAVAARGRETLRLGEDDAMVRCVAARALSENGAGIWLSAYATAIEVRLARARIRSHGSAS